MNEVIRGQAINNVRDLFEGLKDAGLMTTELDKAIMDVIKAIHRGRTNEGPKRVL